MGKKHKSKKHKSREYDDEYEEDREKESLKIVLKVGNSEAPSDVSFTQSPYDERRHKHKKKKKKKSGDRDRHRHTEEDSVKEETEGTVEEEDDDLSQSQEDDDMFEPPTKKPFFDLDDESNSSQDLLPRRPRHAGENRDDEKGILKESLLYIQKNLQKKDVNGFFAYPVNDVIAPGYSSIIPNPMDFSTMFAKIENDQYDSVLDYKTDFVLMCNNAMTYNRPDTIYYKEAKRLLQSAMKLMSKEKLLSMKRNLGFMCSITMDELGVNQQDNTGAVIEAITAKEKEYEITVRNRDKIGRYEPYSDNMTPEEILSQAKAAASEASDMLTLRQAKTKTKLSFLRRRDDGTTSLTVLNTDNDGIINENERIVSLGALTGKLATGTGTIAGFKEDKRNKVNQINYLNYGPFSSHAPVFDTSFSNISKEESDLLLSTYGEESGVQYAHSVMKFVENAEDDCTRIVDGLLDVLTKGQHTITMKQIEQKRAEDKAQLEALKRRMAESEKENVQQSLLMEEPARPDNEVQRRLDKAADLLKDLQQSQYDRLSEKPPPHLGNIQGVNDRESQLAEKVTTELTKLAKDAAPQDVASLRGIRRAMGISVENVVEAVDESQPVEVEEDNTEVINQSDLFPISSAELASQSEGGAQPQQQVVQQQGMQQQGIQQMMQQQPVQQNLQQQQQIQQQQQQNLQQQQQIQQQNLQQQQQNLQQQQQTMQQQQQMQQQALQQQTLQQQQNLNQQQQIQQQQQQNLQQQQQQQIQQQPLQQQTAQPEASEPAQNYIDNELLMEANEPVIDNL